MLGKGRKQGAMETFRMGFYSRLGKATERAEAMSPKLRLGQGRNIFIFQAESHEQWPEDEGSEKQD